VVGAFAEGTQRPSGGGVAPIFAQKQSRVRAQRAHEDSTGTFFFSIPRRRKEGFGSGGREREGRSKEQRHGCARRPRWQNETDKAWRGSKGMARRTKSSPERTKSKTYVTTCFGLGRQWQTCSGKISQEKAAARALREARPCPRPSRTCGWARWRAEPGP
jgi:hypothetical protein